jgi:signal transduction histidine kinase
LASKLSPQIAILVAVMVASLVTAFISYTASTSTAATVNDLALQTVKSNAEIEASDLSHILANKLYSVTSNLQVMTVTQVIQNQELDKARILLDTAQNSTADLTAFYMWLDKDGKLLLLSNANETTVKQYGGTDLSYRDYFIKSRETLRQYNGHLIESNDKVQRIYFSYPIISRQSQQGQGAAIGQAGVMTATTTTTTTGMNTSAFKGALVASVDLLHMGTFLKSQIPEKYTGSVGLIDSEGVILYSDNSILIGKNVFGSEFQSLLRPLGSKFQESFGSFLKDSLGGQAGSSNFAVNGSSVTIAYQPVSLQPKQDFGVLYIVLRQGGPGSNNNHALFDPAFFFDQQRNTSIILIGAVSTVAVAAAYLVLSWNKRLESIVKEKTSALDNANRSLAESNRQLIDANESLKRANEQLQAHDKMQTEFINIAAHELRTPIQPILALSELLEKKRTRNNGGDIIDGNGNTNSNKHGAVELTDTQLAILDRNAKRLQKLSSEILDATRIEAGTLKLEREMMDINQKVRNVIADADSWAPRGQKNSFQIHFQPLTIDPKSSNAVPLPVSIDRVRMFEVVSNLIRNAIKFSGGSGTITITTEKRDNLAIVSIKDQGEGISPDVMSRLFTKFATDKEKGGTGLGLFIAKNIVEAHGGKIWAENNKDGTRGATFTFTLPLANDASSRSSPGAAL